MVSLNSLFFSPLNWPLLLAHPFTAYTHFMVRSRKIDGKTVTGVTILSDTSHIYFVMSSILGVGASKHWFGV